MLRMMQEYAAGGVVTADLAELSRSQLEPQSESWVAISTKPQQEAVALHNLSRQRFHSYCPMVRKQVSHARRRYDVLRPLFPSYLFVNIDLASQRWRPLLSTRGVRSVVRCGDQPSIVDGQLIDALRARECDGVITRPSSPYSVGQHVKVATGPLEGFVAIILEMTEKDRLVALLDMLNRPVRVKLKVDQVAEIARV
jgi:transcriptional antiterminator RfaH